MPMMNPLQERALKMALDGAVRAERQALVDLIAGLRDRYKRNSGDWLTGFEDGCNEAIAAIETRNVA